MFDFNAYKIEKSNIDLELLDTIKKANIDLLQLDTIINLLSHKVEKYAYLGGSIIKGTGNLETAIKELEKLREAIK